MLHKQPVVRYVFPPSFLKAIWLLFSCVYLIKCACLFQTLMSFDLSKGEITANLASFSWTHCQQPGNLGVSFLCSFCFQGNTVIHLSHDHHADCSGRFPTQRETVKAPPCLCRASKVQNDVIYSEALLKKPLPPLCSSSLKHMHSSHITCGDTCQHCALLNPLKHQY